MNPYIDVVFFKRQLSHVHQLCLIKCVLTLGDSYYPWAWLIPKVQFVWIVSLLCIAPRCGSLDLRGRCALGRGSVGLVHNVTVNHTELERYDVYFSIHWRIFGLITGPVIVLLMNPNYSQRIIVKLHCNDISALGNRIQSTVWVWGGG